MSKSDHHEEEHIDEHIHQLQEHLKEVIHEGHYVEAEETKHKIAELKVKNWEQKRTEMELKHTH